MNGRSLVAFVLHISGMGGLKEKRVYRNFKLGRRYLEGAINRGEATKRVLPVSKLYLPLSLTRFVIFGHRLNLM